MRRKEANQMVAHHRQRFLGFRIPQKPLLAQPRLNRHVAPIAEPDAVFVGLGFGKQSTLLQQLGRFRPRFHPIQSIKLRRRRAIDPAVRMQNIQNRQVMPSPNIEIQFVVGRRDL